MTGKVRVSALVLAAGTLMSVDPTPSYSPQLMAYLDPSTRFASLCGGKGGRGMRAQLALAAAIVSKAPAAAKAPPIYDGMGKVNFPVTTSNPKAQAYFDQGLAFAYGFNHAAAISSFREAQRRDPDCAMCWWGEAVAHGPNINAPMDAEANRQALAAVARATALAGRSKPAEQALIAAIGKRYSADPKADRAALDAAYADAMLAAAAAHPANDDLALLAAEAAMDTKPWDYWQADRRTPNPRIGEAVQLVETVLARNADHPQAAHLYIHLMENGPDPKKAEAAADRLAKPLAPTPGHLVHMPAHIYYRLGRWQDSIKANIAAARADEAWIKQSGDRGMVRFGYYPHNVHFIVASAQMAGDLPLAIREAKRLEGIVDTETGAKIAWTQAIHAAPFFAAAQFARPATILAMPAPDPRLTYVTGMRHYARAVAHAQQGDRTGFDKETAALRALAAAPGLQTMIDQGVPARDLLGLAETVARARLASAAGRHGEAVTLFEQAAALEQRIPYMEPPYWYYPVKQSLGAALYRAGRFEEARDAFEGALAQFPNNGWALYGLAAAETRLGHKPQALAAQAALRRAWMGDPNWLRMERL
ncbi:tetratricopeptide repeat protein [Sphingomonas sp. GCM10030256]|uniref:tetratricopeptide repeat protein n=1 Tax=Sphingomonas sp. GCM10030256 TaxID=3273427 RepID=UPI00361180CF